VGQDPETRYTPNGQKVTSFNVATNVRKGGQDVTVWYRITVWGDTFDRMMAYVKKGSALIITGELDVPEVYVAKDGQQRVSLNVKANAMYFSPFGKGDKAGQQEGGAATPQKQQMAQQYAEPAFNSPQTAYGQGQGSYTQQNDDPLPF